MRLIAALLILTSAALSQTAGWIPARWHSHDVTTLDILKSAKAAERGAKRKGNPADLAARSESVLRE